MKANPYEKIDEVPDRQPAYCPYCGQDGAYDGQGKMGQGKYKHHCPDCGLKFITIDPAQ